MRPSLPRKPPPGAASPDPSLFAGESIESAPPPAPTTTEFSTDPLNSEAILDNPCLRCGACCAYFRVSFYWSEADPAAGGTVPPELTERLNPYRAAMRGTLHPPMRCACLDGRIGETVSCSIYEQRPSPCRELDPWDENGQPDEKCSRARAAHDLAPLPPAKPLAPDMPLTPPAGSE